MRDTFTLVRWFALAAFFAGCVFVFFTENPRWWTLFNLLASLLICFDSYVLRRPPELSLLRPAEETKPKFRWPSRLAWIAFSLLLAGFIYGAHIRLSSLLMMSALCLAAYDQYRRTNLNRVVRN
jgi:drug/metabolite transporter (DMT)-like permease